MPCALPSGPILLADHGVPRSMYNSRRILPLDPKTGFRPQPRIGPAVAARTDFCQSLGSATTLNNGAGAEPPILTEPCRDPYDCGCAGSGCIRQQLTEMTMVGLTELILHDQYHVVRLVFAEDVQRVTADCILGSPDIQFNPKSLG